MRAAVGLRAEGRAVPRIARSAKAGTGEADYPQIHRRVLAGAKSRSGSRSFVEGKRQPLLRFVQALGGFVVGHRVGLRLPGVERHTGHEKRVCARQRKRLLARRHDSVEGISLVDHAFPVGDFLGEQAEDFPIQR